MELHWSRLFRRLRGDGHAKGAGHDRFKGVSHIRGLPTEFPDHHFDAVLLLEVVEHLTDEHLNGRLNEVFRLLKPGGVVVITTPNDEDLSVAAKHCPECGAIFHEWQHVRSWNATTLAGHMGGFGFVSQFASPTDFWEHGLIGTAMVKARRILTGRRKRPHLIGTFLNLHILTTAPWWAFQRARRQEERRATNKAPER